MQQLEPGRGRIGQVRKRGRSGSMPGLGQEHLSCGQEQCKSRTGSLYLYLLPVSAPMQYFLGRSRAGQEQGRSGARAGQEQGRSKAGARVEQEQEPNYSPNAKFHPFGVKHKVERFHHWSD